jgi:ferritin-like metal-binding protein YciE
MQKINDLGELLLHHLQNLYAAEDQILRSMPRVIERANHKSLKNALQHHLDLTEEQKKRLKQAIKLISERSSDEVKEDMFGSGTSKGMAGLIEEVEEILEVDIDEDVTDAAIISYVQKIEHYEICAYGTALAFAKQLHLHKVEQLLKETLDEEYDADDLLTALATSSYNKEAAPEGIDEEQQDQEGNEDYSSGKSSRDSKVSITERTINSPGGRAGTSHRGYSTGESRGH